MSNVDRGAVDVAGHEREGLLARLEILVVLRGGNIAVPEVILLRGSLRVDQADARQLFRMGKGKRPSSGPVSSGVGGHNNT